MPCLQPSGADAGGNRTPAEVSLKARFMPGLQVRRRDAGTPCVNVAAVRFHDERG